MQKCIHTEICGGCSLQHISQSDQISSKQEELIRKIKNIPNINNFNILEPIVGPLYGYRNKARLSVKYVIKKDKVLVGFREKNGRYVADLKKCEILNPKIGYLLEDLKLLIQDLAIYNKISQLEVAVGDLEFGDQELSYNAALIVRNLESIGNSDIDKIKNFANKNKLQIYMQPKGLDSIYKLYPEDHKEYLTYSIDNLTYLFHPTDFTQINPDINKKMIKQAISLLDLNEEDVVLDLFCGLGNFSLPIAKLVRKVIGLEGEMKMVKRATENATLNNINNTGFYTEDLFKNIGDQYNQYNINKILIDPPRAGAKECINLITNLAPEKIVYVSCNPDTLVSDIELFIEKGYKLKDVGIMDMFPHTKHVESMALLIPL